VSLKLASALANKKQKILLVDMDFYSPKLSNKLFSTSEIKGLSDFIVNECKLDEIIQQTEMETLQFVTAGNAEGQKELFYNDSNLFEFINWTKNNYDLVIFDTPAAMYIPEIVEFFEKMDSIIVIARLRRTNRNALNKLFKMTASFSEKYIAVILNDLFSGKSDKYDKYGYGYYGNEYSDKTKNNDESSKQEGKIKRPKKSILFLIILLAVILTFTYLFYLRK